MPDISPFEEEADAAMTAMKRMLQQLEQKQHLTRSSSSPRKAPAYLQHAAIGSAQQESTPQQRQYNRSGSMAHYQQIAVTMQRETAQQQGLFGVHRFPDSPGYGRPAKSSRQSAPDRVSQGGQQGMSLSPDLYEGIAQASTEMHAPDLYGQLCMEESASQYHRQGFAASLSNIFQRPSGSRHRSAAQHPVPTPQYSYQHDHGSLADLLRGAQQPHRNIPAQHSDLDQELSMHHSYCPRNIASMAEQEIDRAAYYQNPYECTTSEADSPSWTQRSALSPEDNSQQKRISV